MTTKANRWARNTTGGALTWRLVSGGCGLYGRNWANGGRSVFRDGFSRLYLLEAGQVTLESAGATARLRPGELWVIPGGVASRYRCQAPLRLNWLHFNVFVVPELDLLAGRAPRRLASQEGTLTTFSRILEALEQGAAGLVRATALAAGLLVPFVGEVSELATDDGVAMQRLRPALARVQEQLGGDCSVCALAGDVGLHPVYFSRLFRRTLGMPPGEYVLTARMRRAAILLATTLQPIKAIGAACGYPDPYHFSRAFKRHTGLAPTGYRRAQG